MKIGVVQHQEPLGVLDGVAVLLEDGDAEAVEGVESVGELFRQKDRLDSAGDVVGAVEDCDIPVGDSILMKPLNLSRHPLGLLLLGVGVVTPDRRAGGQGGNQVLLHPLPVLLDQRVGCR